MTENGGPEVASRRAGAKGRKRRSRLTPNLVAKALIQGGGSISQAAHLLGCARQSVYRVIAANPGLTEIVDHAREELLDDAEGALWAAVKRGERWAICFTLRYLGWSRGYGHREGQLPPVVRVTIDLDRVPDDILKDLQMLAQSEQGAKLADTFLRLKPADPSPWAEDRYGQGADE
ncbi:MAG: helix-turn-helix domain-containing protein [Thermoguttaceae bacterium]|nr:helix-turn-helix domain-containing protein [Thermoguttaceae bacterium]